ncbi:MAG: Gfo/Idh/MocA family oxidoreductase [Spirochaetaceae bacterium]|nr:Gfo/Idh/MocA family oxidoreductase [Spirochaetaceae bacterium]
MPKPEAVNWGILGPGRIAVKFAIGLRDAAGARLVAVGSRSAERAARFAAEYGAARAHAGYEALAADPDVHAVYVATPHPQHAAACRLCLEAGKHVLCEKPLTVNAAEARAVAACAREHGVLLMEGMWTRFIPATAALRALIDAGEIGEPHVVHADIGFASAPDPASRLFAPELAGGALLDLGVYCVSFASMLLGTPSGVAAAAHLGATGVDERTAVSLRYPGGAVAALTCSLTTRSPHLASVVGSGGYVIVGPRFWRSERLIVHRGDAAPDERRYPHTGNGFNYEAEHFMELIRAGATDSRVMPLAESIAISETLDAARRAIGVRYPFETEEEA